MANYFLRHFSVELLKAKLNQPFRVATGQHDSLENVLLTIELSDGVKGYGEAAIATHITGETISQTVKNLNIIGKWLLTQDVSDYLLISSQLHERLPNNKAALAAVEMAMVDALTKSWNIPLWKFFGSKSKRLVSDITIVIGSLEETMDSVQRFYCQGFRTFKVKIGKDQDLDFKRILAFRQKLPYGSFYIDANQGYSAKEMGLFLKNLAKHKIIPDLIEQPVPKQDWEGLCQLTRDCAIPICADESVSSLGDAVRAVKDKAVDAINIKLMKTGIFQSREIAFLAKANGIKLMIGGMMESSLAMTTSAHLAAGLGCFDYIDLDTPFFIKDGLKKNPYLNSRGVYDLKTVKRGVGIAP